MKKRLLSILLVLCLLLSILPITTSATSSGDLIHEPKVTEFTVTYMDGEESKTVSLLDNPQQVVMNEGCKPVFTVRFDTSALLDKVYITSTKEGATKYLEALPTDTNTYATEGYFDPEDTTYVPGTLSISYTKKTATVSNNDTIEGIDLTQIKQQLESAGISVNGEIVDSGDHSVSAEIVLRDYFGTTGEELVTASVSELSSSAGIDDSTVNDWLGGYSDLLSFDLKGNDGSDYTLYFANQDWLDTDSYLMVVRDVSGSKYVKMLLHGAELNEIAENLSNVNTVVKSYLDYVGISEEMDTLREEVDMHPTMSIDQKAEAYNKINDLEADKQLFTMGMTFVPLFLGAVAGGPPIMITALLAGYSSVAGYFWEQRIGMIQGCEPVENAFSASAEHAGWTAITKEYMEQHDNILQDGNYYLAEDIYGRIKVGSMGKYLGDDKTVASVKICLHGYRASLIDVYEDSSAIISDCMYQENDDGHTAGGSINDIVVEKNGNLVINDVVVSGSNSSSILNEGGEVTVNGGIISNVRAQDHGILNKDGGKVTINSGRIDNGIYSQDGGTIIINGGIINIGMIWSIWTDTGAVTINNGQVDGEITVETGTLTVRGGNIDGNISTESGTITINKGAGIINGTISNSAGIVTIHGGIIQDYDWGIYNSGTVCIDGGTVAGNSGQGTGISNQGGKVIISGGTVKSAINRDSIKNEDGGEIIISGGTIIGCISNHIGTLKISGGSFEDQLAYAIDNYGEGSIAIISGGVFKDFIESRMNCSTTISGGVFQAGIRINSYQEGENTLTLLINEKTVIEVGCNPDDGLETAFEGTPIIKASDGYSGGVTYYSAADGVGIPMTIEQAAEIDFTQPYIRLVAGGSAQPPVECEHSYSSVLTLPTCTQRGYTTHTCSKCGDSYTDSYTAALGHDFGPWDIIQAASSDTAGLRERTCSRCGDKETQVIPATGGTSSGSSGSSSSQPSYYINTEPSTIGGKVKLSSTKAPSGATVTLTVIPDDGYELASLSVADKIGNNLKLTDQGSGTYSFVMPASKVYVEAAFAKTEQSVNDLFIDVPGDAYYYDAVQWAAEKGITSGTSATTFSPYASCTRAQAVTFLWRAAGSPTPKSSVMPFSDVASDAYYNDAVLWATENSITSGTSATTFTPDANCTRAQIVTFLWRAEEAFATDLENPFVDVASDAYYRDAVLWATENGITSGTSATTFTPDANCTRAQIVTFLYREEMN